MFYAGQAISIRALVFVLFIGLSHHQSRAAQPVPAIPVPFDFAKCTEPVYPAAAFRAEAVGTVVVSYALALDSKLAWATIEQSSGRTREHKLLDRIALAEISECIGKSTFSSLSTFPMTGRVAVIYSLAGEVARSRWLAQPAPALPELERSRLQQMLADIASQAQEAQRSKRDAAIVEYRSLYAQIRTLEDIELFEKAFSDDDPEKLIPKLAVRKTKLRLDRYRQAFQEASDSALLRVFILNYENDDPDKLVPVAKQKLSAVSRLESEKRARDLKAEQDAAIARRSQSLETEIRQCQRQIEISMVTINKEKEVGRVSGYENASVLHAAGRRIVECRNWINEFYPAYRASGGTKRLEEIR